MRARWISWYGTSPLPLTYLLTPKYHPNWMSDQSPVNQNNPSKMDMIKIIGYTLNNDLNTLYNHVNSKHLDTGGVGPNMFS